MCMYSAPKVEQIGRVQRIENFSEGSFFLYRLCNSPVRKGVSRIGGSVRPRSRPMSVSAISSRCQGERNPGWNPDGRASGNAW